MTVVNHIDTGRIPLSPPVVPPVEVEVMRPLWSIMIPVYNCSKYLTETLTSVLEQCKNRPEVQIEVVDDASTDADVQSLVLSVGEGRVGYFSQTVNVGSLRNFHTCLVRARGMYVHILHGDDKVRHGFYNRFEKFFAANPTAAAAYCRFAYIDEAGKFLFHHERESEKEGILSDFISRLGERQRIQYASMVVKREVYENLGSFYGVEYGEDWEMWMRIASRYQIGYIPDVLADYRKHSASISGRTILTGKNVRDLREVMQRIEPLLPEQKKFKIISSSKKFYAHYALRTANQIWSTVKSRAGVKAQVREAWSMHKDFFLVYKILKLYTKMTLNI
jgi:glycosyltransferase involved in cell wall biosynthesis